MAISIKPEQFILCDPTVDYGPDPSSIFPGSQLPPQPLLEEEPPADTELEKLPRPCTSLNCRQARSYLVKLLRSANGGQNPQYGNPASKPPFWPDYYWPWEKLTDVHTKPRGMKEPLLYSEMMKLAIQRGYKYYGYDPETFFDRSIEEKEPTPVERGQPAPILSSQVESLGTPPKLPRPNSKLNCVQARTVLSKLLRYQQAGNNPVYGHPETRPPWWPEECIRWVDMVDLRGKPPYLPHDKSYTDVLKIAIDKGLRYFGYDAEKHVDSAQYNRELAAAQKTREGVIEDAQTGGPPKLPVPVNKLNCGLARTALSRLLRYHCGNQNPQYGNEETRPEWWPNDVFEWSHLRNLSHRYDGNLGDSYSNCLRLAIIQGYEFYGKDPNTWVDDLGEGLPSVPGVSRTKFQVNPQVREMMLTESGHEEEPISPPPGELNGFNMDLSTHDNHITITVPSNIGNLPIDNIVNIDNLDSTPRDSIVDPPDVNSPMIVVSNPVSLAPTVKNEAKAPLLTDLLQQPLNIQSEANTSKKPPSLGQVIKKRPPPPLISIAAIPELEEDNSNILRRRPSEDENIPVRPSKRSRVSGPFPPRMSVNAHCEEDTRKMLNNCRVDLSVLSVKESAVESQLCLTDFLHIATSEIKSVFMETLKTSFTTGVHSDFEIVFKGGKKLFVHKLILAAHSPELSEILGDSEVTSLILPEVEFAEGKLLTEALYTGRVNFDRRHAVSLSSVESTLASFREIGLLRNFSIQMVPRLPMTCVKVKPDQPEKRPESPSEINSEKNLKDTFNNDSQETCFISKSSPVNIKTYTETNSEHLIVDNVQNSSFNTGKMDQEISDADSKILVVDDNKNEALVVDTMVTNDCTLKSKTDDPTSKKPKSVQRSASVSPKRSPSKRKAKNFEYTSIANKPNFDSLTLDWINQAGEEGEGRLVDWLMKQGFLCQDPPSCRGCDSFFTLQPCDEPDAFLWDCPNKNISIGHSFPACIRHHSIFQFSNESLLWILKIILCWKKNTSLSQCHQETGASFDKIFYWYEKCRDFFGQI